MTKFSKYLLVAILFAFLLLIPLFLCIYLWQSGYGGEKVTISDIMPGIVMIGVMLIVIIGCIFGCIKHKNDPENALQTARLSRLARTEGTVLSGLPIVASNVEINLFSDKIEFSVYANLSGSKRQNYNLNLNKITRIYKQITTRNASVVSQSMDNAIISNTQDQDILVIDYMDNAQPKQIMISLPIMMSGVSKFIKEFEKIKPQSNQPVEL